MVFEYKLTVRGYELDSFNHVNNAVYLNYLEQARWGILQELNLMDVVNEKGLFLVVTEINIRFMKEAKIFDNLLVKTEIEKENPYLIFKQSIYNEDTGAKITKAVVKTLLIDQDKIPYDVPDVFFAKQ
jgi:YbgC/YbaW family acyl-CoA thioester hydrolase